MRSPHQPVHVERHGPQGSAAQDDQLAVEAPVALTVNGQVWLTFMCTPADLEALAIGFLFNEGVIDGMQAVADVRVCEHGDNVDVWLHQPAEQPAHWRRTSGCAGGQTAVETLAPAGPVPDGITLTPAQVEHLTTLLSESQELYRQSGGLHASLLSDGETVIAAAEDIGRHNTLDKIAGKCLLQDLRPARRVLVTTGRISSEMLQKAARLGAPVIISRTAPSSLSVELADKRGMTLIGYARRGQFNVYTHHERIIPPA